MTDFAESFSRYLDKPATDEKGAGDADAQGGFAGSFRAFLDERDAEAESAAKANLYSAMGTNPDQAAKAATLGKRFGLSTDTVLADLGNVERRAVLEDRDRVLQRSPTLRSWLASNPDAAKLVHDDLSTTAGVAAAVDRYNEANSLPARAAQRLGSGWAAMRGEQDVRGAVMAGDALNAFDAIDNGETPNALRSRLYGENAKRHQMLIDDLTDQYFGETPEGRADMRKSHQDVFDKNLDSAAAREDEVEAAPRNPAASAAMEKAGKGDFGDAWGAFMTDPLGVIGQIGMESLPRALPGMAAGVVAGPAAGMGAGSFVSEYGARFLSAMKAEGLDLKKPETRALLRDPEIRKRASEKAATGAAVVAAFDAMSGGMAGEKLLSGARAGASAVREIAREGAEIAAQFGMQASLGMAGEAGAETATGEKLQWGQILAEGLGEGFGAPGEMLSAAGNHAFTRAEPVVRRAGEAERAKVAAEHMDAAVEGVVSSKLMERSPEAAASLLRSQTEGTQSENVFIPAREAQAYFQSAGVTPDALDTMVPGLSGQIREAAPIGADVVIPTADYLTRLAPEHHQGLREDIRSTEGGMTLREANDFDPRKAIEEAASSAEADVDSASARETARATIADDVAKRLSDGGWVAPETAKTQAEIIASFFTTTAERAGVDPEELYRSVNFDVTRSIPDVLRGAGEGVPPALSKALEDLRRGTGQKSDKTLFGPSLLQFVADRGGVIDEGGDLHSQGVDRYHEGKPFQRKVVRNDDGVPLDEMTRKAWEAGYFPESGDERPTINDLRAAMIDENNGRPRYVTESADVDAAGHRAAVEDLARTLDEIGIDPAKHSDAEIVAALRKAADEGSTIAEQALVYDQAARDPIAKVLTGDEVAPAGEPIESLRSKARALMRGWVSGGKSAEIVNADTGMRIGFDRKSFEKAPAKIGERLLRVIPAIPDMLRSGHLLSTEPGNRDGVAKLHKFTSAVDLAGQRVDVVLHVHEKNNGERFYSLHDDRGTVGRLGAVPGVASGGEAVDPLGVGDRPASGMIPETEDGGNSFDQKRDTDDTPEDRVRSVLDAAAMPGNASSKTAIGVVGPWLVDMAREKLGVDITGYRHVIDTSAVKHIRNRHGAEAAERARGQIPLTDEDIAHIPDLLSSPDKVVFGTKNRLGHDQIAFVKTLPDGSTLYLEEVRTGRRELAAMSMRKYPATMNVEAVAATLDPNARGDGENGLSIIDAPRDPNMTFSQIGGGDDPRGRITFKPGPDGRTEKAIITLFSKADLSTVMHEAGHLFLQITADLHAAEGERLPDQMRADWAVTLDFLGAKPGEKLTTEQHETFARAWEEYLREGKAPSKGLRRVFEHAWAWLRAVYKGTPVEGISTEMRGVFDRMIAADDEIAAAARETGLVDHLAKYKGVATDAELEALARAADEARIEAKARVMSAAVKEAEREKAAWWKEARAALRTDVALEISDRPEYAALTAITKGTYPDGSPFPAPIKLSRAAAAKRTALKSLPRGVTAEDGVHPDIAAEMLGFSSGDELLQALSAIKDKPLKEVVDAETDRRMAETYGDMRTDGTLHARALEAMRDEEAGKVVAAELRILRRAEGERLRKLAERKAQTEGGKKAAEYRDGVDGADERAAMGEDPSALDGATARADAKAGADQRRAQSAAVRSTLAAFEVDADAARQIAIRSLSTKPLKTVSPDRYEAAANRASDRAALAVAKRDYAAAALAKRDQLINHFMAIEARKLKQEAEKVDDFVRTLRKSNDKWAKTHNIDFVNAARALAARHGYHFPDGLNLEQWGASLREFYPDRADEIADHLSAAIAPEPLRPSEMTIGDLRAFHEGIIGLLHYGRKEREAFLEGRKADFEAKRTELVTAIEAENEEIKTSINPSADGPAAKAMDQLSSFLALNTKARTYAERMGGRGGIGDRLLTEAVRDAELTRDRRKAVEAEIAARILEESYGEEARNGNLYSPKSRVKISGTNESLTLQERLAIGLNWGNEENRAALLNDKFRRDKKGFTPDAYDAVLATLERRDWEFIQKVWDHLEAFRPELAALEREDKGFEPRWIEPAPFTVRFANGETLEMRGGYYPLKYDPELSSDVRENTAEEEARAFAAGHWGSATTRAGHVKARVGSNGKPVKWSLNVWEQHLGRVVTDITMRRSVRGVWRMLNDHKVKAAIETRMGKDAWRQLDLWIKDVAVAEQRNSDAMSSVLNRFRSSVTVGAMALKATTVITQVSGFSHTMVELGKARTLRAVGEYLANPIAAARWVREASPFMASRAGGDLNRDMRDVIARARGHGWRADAVTVMFYPIAKAQAVVDIPTWIGAFRKAEEEGKDRATAVRYADSAVEAAQGGSQASMLSAFERGTMGETTRLNDWIKVWGAFISYFNTKFNIARRKWEGTDFRSPAQIASLAGDYLALFWLDTLIADTLKNAPSLLFGNGGDDDDDKGVASRIAKSGWSAVQTAMGMLPFLRELAGTMEGFGAAPAASRGIANLGNALGAVGRTASDLAFGEDVRWMRLVRAINQAIPLAIPWPSGQVDAALAAQERANKGEDVPLVDYLIKPAKK